LLLHGGAALLQVGLHTPPTHPAVPNPGFGHTALSHAPQWLTLVLRSTQVVPHSVGVLAGHELTHPDVAEQLYPAAHLLPHPAQFMGDVKSVSQPSSGLVEQCPVPERHAELGTTHLLAEQVTPALLATLGSVVQSWPQLPQFFTSVVVEMHVVPQRVIPVGHCMPHAPAWQVALPPPGAGQTLAQSPQWLASVFKSTQVLPPHRVGVAAGHELVHPEAAQIGLFAGHTVVQPWQCEGDDRSVSQPSSGAVVQWA
jgi:hypothetical protein